MRLTIVVGNPKPKSRTLQVAQALAAQVAAVTGAVLDRTIDLCDYADELFQWPNPELAAINDAVAQSDLLIVGSPTYKAAYTGLLKAFLDRYPNDGLAGVVAIPVMTAGNPVHGMAVETTLRPLLVELGATVPTRGLFFPMSLMAELDETIEDWARQNLDGNPTLKAMKPRKVPA